MRPADLNELRRIQIEILDVVTQYCTENDIDYWLDSGTLIGAIRHNGYIPWDDDIDIGMLRPAFDRFLLGFNGYNARYIVKCAETDPSFTYAIAKVMDTHTTLYEPDEKSNKLHINIDIFVYDNAPDDARVVAKMFSKRDIYRDLNVLRTLRNKPSGNIFRRAFIRLLRIMLLPFPKSYFVYKEIENSKAFSEVRTERVGNFLGYARATWDREILNTLIVHEFEDKQYKIPERYDEYLTGLYGDYMKLPPIDERVSHHTFKAYIEDNE